MEEERREVIPRRKMTLELIEEKSLRKACYKKRREGLLKKMKEITTLCGIDACIVIHSPDEAVPTVWPSPDVAKHLIQRLHSSIPESELYVCKRMVDHHSFMLEKVKRMERALARLKEINEEKQMSLFFYQIRYEGKPLSDFTLDEAKRLLHYVDEKLKQVRLRIGPSQEMLSDPYNNNSAMMSNFGDLNDGNDSLMLSYGNFGDFNAESGIGTMLPQSSNFGGENKLGMLLTTHSNFVVGGLNSDLGSAPQNTMFQVLNAALDRAILAEAIDNNFGENDLMGVPQFSSRGINGEENLEVLYGGSATEIGGSNNWGPYGIASAIGQNNGIGIDDHNDQNYNGPINHITGFQQFNPNNFGPNNSSEAAMGEFNANLFGSNDGIN